MKCSKLRNIRISKKLSVPDVAQLANISRSYMYQLENGNKNPSYKIMLKLSKILNLPASELFFNDGEKEVYKIE